MPSWVGFGCGSLRAPTGDKGSLHAEDGHGEVRLQAVYLVQCHLPISSMLLASGLIVTTLTTLEQTASLLRVIDDILRRLQVHQDRKSARLRALRLSSMREV